MLLYSNKATPRFKPLATQVALPLVIGISGKESLTANNVAQVRAAWQRQPARYEALFDQIDRLALAGVDALAAGDLVELGELMNLNHGLLNALQLSTPELEEMVHAARRAGAVGAKLTGGGGGGSMVALCPANAAAVAAAIEAAGFQTLSFTVAAGSA